MSAPGPRSQQVILLVEDQEDDIELTRVAFADNEAGARLVVARDGAEALSYLDAASPLPRLVLLDLNLPKVDGLEVLARVRANARTCALPVVMLSTSTEERDILMSYRRGANSYVRKPVDFEQFHAAVRSLVRYWLLLNEPGPA